ncbi:enoyl-CoA hydratase/isomerase family protein [Runella slithyformis]|uniref:Enoyl-CoA hydratase/isomerase n=1 Tax=Runella slithyformis (strain ATCC 29530 / DSM 19594 / LMG 11500 / NCIMB 11436 / LSU 4) TaxID=761193 RepID=A0A7U4E3R5_RUNSL|nr:enoyl-CoA hydratase/isomerase family protein [Runella slithyformis]AEI46676.1 Enoyl-CoA hydratase/isomerase [Runella slithyformis DSM 19594]
MDPYVTSELTPEGIATVTFFHPAQNAMPGFLLRQLAETIEETGHNPAVKVLILQSSGDRTFCAGASFDELAAIQNEEEGKTFFSGFANVINACRKSPLIILGKVQGKAVGGGVGLAAATDYCFATQHAAIRLSELGIGIGPFVVGPAIERKIGLSAFSQLTLNASTFYDAFWAKEKGLYAEVFDTVAEMDAAIGRFAQSFTQHSPVALQQVKKIFWEGTEHWETLLAERAAMSGRLVLSDFTRSAVAQIKAAKP